MTDQMDIFYQKIQTFLIKKDSEVGKLKFLSSKSTEENIKHIEEVTTSVCSIFEGCNIPIKEKTSTSSVECIKALQYLILNTDFKTQEFLQEDFLHGHLVDICPPLSPYLLIELVWHLEYEGLLAESILNLPLDLCIEVLEILRRYAFTLGFPRVFNLLLTLTRHCYIKVLIIGDVGTHSLDFDTNLEKLIINYQEILSLLENKKCLRLLEVSGIDRSERYGYILQEILILTRTILELNGRKVTTESEKQHKLYEISLGRGTLRRCDTKTVNHHLKSLTLCLMNVLLKKVKEINCDVYIDWASLNPQANPSISLQQKIGIECFHLIQLIKENDTDAHEHLIECLQQLSVKPESIHCCTTTDLKELCKGVEEGNHDYLKQLLIQCNKWDNSVFHSIRKRVDLFDKDDFLNLLEYLTELIVNEKYGEEIQIVYNTLTKIFFRQKLKDLYEIILQYILKHDGDHILESLHSEQRFMDFLLNNVNFITPNKLKILLFFLLKNPQKFLMILIKICIGSEKYNNLMINPDDLILLSPVMTIRNGTGNLVLFCLLKIALENDEFSFIKFSNFIKSMIEHHVFTTDELFNSVYIPLIKTVDLPYSTVRSILINLRQIAVTLNDVNLELLLKSMVEKMSQLRYDRRIPNLLNTEMLTLTIRVVETVLGMHDNWFVDVERRRWIIDFEATISPVDKLYFSKLFNTSEYLDITEIIEDYSRRINTTIQKVIVKGEPILIHNCFNRYVNLEDEIMKHVIFNCTEAEYTRLAFEITAIDWNECKNSNLIEGFDKIVRITIEACDYCLKSLPNHDKFGSLIKSLSKFLKGLIHLDLGIDMQFFLESFLNNFRKLSDSVQGTEYQHFYNETVLWMNNRPSNESTAESLAEVVNLLSCFGDKCLSTPIKEKCDAKKIYRSQISQNFISICLMVSLKNQCCTINRVKNLLLPTS
ncbi:uncharacterized protein [Fopius arisanus]|uniref:Uncharacterized protein n=1 Tax=Fopius arisanus TaxID=64838 RepID=A0A9R1T8H4_9HYME|nr:PREDICTED: uncharacterized protein LOC105267475 [Fopius arisanus]